LPPGNRLAPEFKSDEERQNQILKFMSNSALSANESQMEWQVYEQVTKYIYETLGKEAGVKIEGHGKDCKVKGKSGVDHQIDVMTSHTDGIHTYKTAIECKYWKESVNKDIIMKVAEVIEDSGINKGVIVSKCGFTQDAVNFAKYKNIGLVELREMEEHDWRGRGRVFDIKTFVRRPEILNIVVDNVGPNLAAEEIKPDQIKIHFANGKTTTFANVVNEFKHEVRKTPIGTPVEKYYPFVGAKMIHQLTKKITKIRGIKFKGILTEKDAGIKFHPVDEIWLIMKSIFEEKTFTISKKGVIKQDPPKA
jgi:hypothetical protein